MRMSVLKLTYILCMICLMTSCNVTEQDLQQLEKENTNTKIITNDVILPFPLTIMPTFKQMFINTEFQFNAQGGTPPYQFSLVSGGGSIEAAGKYLSPGSPGNAVVRVTDSKGAQSDSLVTIDSELVITPSTKKLNVSTSFTFNVTGGNPPYNFAIASGGGSIDANGVFTAPALAGQSIIRVTDNRGIIVNATVDVGAGPVLSPTSKKIAVSTSFAFSVVGGTPPLIYAVSLGSGSIDGAGNFTAPATPGTSTIRVTDSQGYSSEASIEYFVWNQIAVSQFATCVLKGNSNEVKCFGNNQHGQMGQDGTIVGDQASDMGDNLLPASLALAPEVSPISVAATGVSAIATILDDITVIDDGPIKAWGYSGHSANGYDWGGDSINPARLGEFIPMLIPGASRAFVQVEGGYYHFCGVLDNGDVKCWGYNGYGQLGQDNTSYYGASPPIYSTPPVNLGGPATKVTAGYLHSCALLVGGTVKCWGYNAYGQLGYDNTDQLGDAAGEMAALAPVNFGGKTVIDISAGWVSTCVAFSDGKARCWGYNPYGNLGIGNTNTIGDAAGEMATLTDLTDVSFLPKKIVKITSGIYHVCALLDDNSLRCWGYNAYGQLGLGDTVNRGAAPGQMATLTAVPLGTGKTVKEVEAGNYWTCAILNDDSLKCWGYNIWGQLGLGHRRDIGKIPEDMGDSLLTVNLGTNAIPKKLAKTNGDNNCAVIEKDGRNGVYCWGRVLYGEDGTGRAAIGLKYNEMGSGLASVNLGTINGDVNKISHTYLGFCAIGNSGTTKCWGYNEGGYRLLGSNSAEWAIGDTFGEIGSCIPNLNAGLGVKAVHVEGDYQSPFSCGLFDDTSLRCWGYNPYGNLGQDNTSNYTYIPTTAPINLGAGRTAIQFSVGTYSVCARLDNGTVKCWGYNPYGNLGQGHTNNLGDQVGEMAALTPVDLGTGLTAKYVCTNNYHACAITNNDKIKCWGYGGNGQLGYENTNNIGDAPGEMGDALAYVNLGTGRTVKKLSCGVNYNCAILDNDKMKCWGYNAQGQLGLNTTAAKGTAGGTMGDLLPYVNLGTGRTAIDVKTGYYHTCAVLDNNDVKCWGYNHLGQIGAGMVGNFGDSAGEMGDALLPLRF
ncbi:MAG: hypothetical protein HYV97_15515 [Bdellovibrio sp.]|nr:hypothetical protein [Bdellovibrio sp.]